VESGRAAEARDARLVDFAPTLAKLLGIPAPIDAIGSDLQDALAESVAFTVRDVMNPDPITFKEDTPIEEMVEAFSAHHRVNPVPVTNREGIVTGIVSRYDIIKFYAFMLRKAKNMK